MPDPVHVFKNIAGVLTKGQQFVLDDIIVEKYGLPSNIASTEPVMEVFKLQKKGCVEIMSEVKRKYDQPHTF